MVKFRALLPTTIVCVLIILMSITVNADNNKMKFYGNAKAIELPSFGIEGVNAFLKDVVHSNDPNAPISCGLFRMEKGDALEYTYTYHEAKIIVHGEMTIAEEGGETVHAKAGDIVYFDKGAKITFTSDSSGLGFYCGQRAADGV